MKSPEIHDQYEGTLSLHARGFGFSKITPQIEVFIPQGATMGALNGDKVLIEITGKDSPKGPEGKIIAILDRKKRTLSATVISHDQEKTRLFIPELGKKSPAFMWRLKENLNPGDRIAVLPKAPPKRPKKGSGKAEELECTAVAKIGTTEDAKSDLPFVACEFGLALGFSKEVLDEIAAITFSTGDREDLTHLQVVTIDPKDSKDHDDALSIEKLPNGGSRLGVHIADVSYFVRPGSAIDKEALARGNSTYFPGICIPMLPERLSSDLCSLHEKKPRLAVTVMADFDAEGRLLSSRIFRSLIEVKKRLSYEAAFEILKGEAPSPFAHDLLEMEALAKKLRADRKARGSVDLAMRDAKLEVDANGEPTGVTMVEYDASHQLVEEFMLKANELVALELSARKIPSLYRVHEAPADTSINDFLTYAERLGLQVKRPWTQEDIQALFEKVKETPYVEQLSIAFIRSMKLAIYSENNVGHWGLSLTHYSHFTSPIRRYSDLVVHRLLLEPFDPEEAKKLEGIALHCSEKERSSFKAESRILTIKKLRLLRRLKAEGKDRFEAYVSQVRPFGVTFEIPALMFEGFLPLSELGDDFYIFNETQKAFIGKRRGERLELGSKIKVLLERVDLLFLESRFCRAG